MGYFYPGEDAVVLNFPISYTFNIYSFTFTTNFVTTHMDVHTESDLLSEALKSSIPRFKDNSVGFYHNIHQN